MGRAKHIHKFIRVGRKGYESKIWKCALSDCTWFVHLGLSHVMLGKPCICWGCDEPFILDERAMEDDQPKCIECRLIGSQQEETESEPEPEPEGATRTPEQEELYNRQMTQMFGKGWRKLLESQ